MSLVQITAAVIFMVMFVLIVTEKIERQWSALLCGITMIVVVFMLLMRDMKAVVDVLAVKTIFKSTFWYQSGAGGEESRVLPRHNQCPADEEKSHPYIPPPILQYLVC